MNATKVFNTLDLVRTIYSFGDPDHRRQTRQIGSDILHTHDFLDHMTQYRYFCTHKVTIKEFIQSLGEGSHPYLRQFKRCYCCQRHNHLKPILHEGRVMILEGTVTETESDICFCACRHYSRKIIRTLFTLL